MMHRHSAVFIGYDTCSFMLSCTKLRARILVPGPGVQVVSLDWLEHRNGEAEPREDVSVHCSH